jgi:RNA polymerase sigma-70 factor (ECF subfamily)
MSGSENVWQHGRQARFAALVQEHYRPVYKFCFWLSGPHRDAEDVCQQVFLTAWRKFEQLRDPSKAKSWLMRIALNTARTEARRSARRDGVRLVVDAEQTAPSGEDDPAGSAAAVDRRRLIRESVQALPEEQRAVVVLRVMQGLRGKDVSDLLGISEATVSRWNEEGLQILRGKLLRSGVLPEDG